MKFSRLFSERTILLSSKWDKWAKTIQRNVDAANKAWNESHLGNPPIRIAWGHRNNKEARRERARSPAHRNLEGLINQEEWDFEINIAPGDSDVPDMAYISVDFEHPSILPRSPRELYNVLHHIQPGVRLNMVPRESHEEISIIGVEVGVALDCITPRVWGDALAELKISHHQLHDYLFHDEGNDWWADWFQDAETESPPADEE
jgi:hypothetical protein